MSSRNTNIFCNERVRGICYRDLMFAILWMIGFNCLVVMIYGLFSIHYDLTYDGKICECTNETLRINNYTASDIRFDSTLIDHKWYSRIIIDLNIPDLYLDQVVSDVTITSTNITRKIHNDTKISLDIIGNSEITWIFETDGILLGLPVQYNFTSCNCIDSTDIDNINQTKYGSSNIFSFSIDMNIKEPRFTFAPVYIGDIKIIEEDHFPFALRQFISLMIICLVFICRVKFCPENDYIMITAL